MHFAQLRGSAALLLPIALMVGTVAQSLHAQIPASAAQFNHDTDAPVAQAVRINQPLVIDGRLDEAVWMTAPPISDFRQTTPDEGAPVTERTEVRFLYDDDNIYVGAWLWDEGQILSRLARRDAGVPDADFFVVLFDSYHDHRTAYRFSTSPAGMKRDEIVTGDRGGGGPGGPGGGGFGDTSWDPIWEIKTSITDQGWFVEMRIPFSQLRYSREHTQVWGLQVERKIRRHGEDTVWAFTPSRERGGVARYGHLVGIEGIAQGKRAEFLPYVGGRAEYRRVPQNPAAPFANPFRSGSDYFGNAGIDVKYRLTSNLTLDATINPDFGQVEMDPAIINLTAFETRFDEKRPFFIEGAEIFRFGEAGGRPGGMDSQLLYSRRVGRAPQVALPSTALYGDVPGASTILGAMKLTGKTVGGWSVGVLNAVTGREVAPFMEIGGVRNDAVVEPLSNYFAGRLRRDVRSGAGSMGIIGTAVHRRLENDVLSSRLRSSAFALGLDGRIDMRNREWTLAGELSPSYITGQAPAVALTQRSSARYLHRPDATHLEYDPTATSLSGLFGRVDLQKRAGAWRGGATITGITPGYEVNDLGFQSSADRIDLSTGFGYEQTRPGRYLRRWSTRVGPSASWNFGQEIQSRDVMMFGNAQLLSFHGVNFRFGRQLEAWNDRMTRGGPLTRDPAGYGGGIGFNTDSRGAMQLRTNLNYSGDDAGGWSRGGSVNMTYRIGGIYEFQVGPDFRRTHTAAQYVTTVTDATATNTFGRRYIFAPLDQTTAGIQTRFNATFTPELSFELYAQPFVSTGHYGTLKELAAPRTFQFREYGSDVGTIRSGSNGRFVIDPDGEGPAAEFRVIDPDFNFRSLLGNAVLRWEWRPGSTLFLVWQQVRSERVTPEVLGDTATRRLGSFHLERDARALAGLKPDNIFLIKLNYWLNP
jgi:hypothetical protein